MISYRQKSLFYGDDGKIMTMMITHFIDMFILFHFVLLLT